MTSYVQAAKRKNTSKGSTFRPAWLQKYPWLRANNVEAAAVTSMHCEACKEYPGGGSFGKDGSTSLRVDTITGHEKTSSHKAALLLWEKQQQPAELRKEQLSEIASMYEQLSKTAMTALKKRLRIAYFIALNKRPLSDYKLQVDLVESLGCPDIRIPSELSKRGIDYISHEFIEDAIQALAEWLFAQQLKLFEASDVLGLLLDESTDAGNLKQLVLCVRGVALGEAFVRFCAILELEDGTAETITTATLAWLEENKIDPAKILGLATDGASVMTGRKSGASVPAFCRASSQRC